MVSLVMLDVHTTIRSHGGHLEYIVVSLFSKVRYWSSSSCGHTQDGGWTILGLVVLRMVVPSDLHHTQDGDTSEPGHTHGLAVLMLLLD